MLNVQIARNAVIGKLIQPHEKVASFVNSLLSYEVEGGFGGNEWSGKSSFFDIRSNSFPAGFCNVIQTELTKIGYKVHMIAKPLDPPLGPESPVVDAFGNDDPNYDYQLQTLRQVEKHGAGIVRVATGGGKSRIAKMIMARYRRMTLFITTRGILLYQMKDQLDAIGINSGVISEGDMKLVRGINLGMVQTLVQSLEEPSLDREIRALVSSIHTSKKKDSTLPRDEIVAQATQVYEAKLKRRANVLKFLELVEVVIGEEAHEAGGTSYYEILRHCKNAKIRVALTATPFMRSSAPDNMRLMAAFGPVLIDISEEMLIERGILAKPYFRLVDCAPHEKLRKHSPFERAYQLGYVENTHMHAEILKDAMRAQAYGLPVLTLISRKKHGDVLLKLFRANGLKVEFLQGEDKMAVRKEQLRKLVNHELDVIIGTTILDVGVDVPALGLVQLCGGMKAEVSLRQRIGRGLRAKKTGPNIAFVADYTCNLNPHLRDHARQRERIIRSIPGFAENVLEPGMDFPWALFDTKILAT